MMIVVFTCAIRSFNAISRHPLVEHGFTIRYLMISSQRHR